MRYELLLDFLFDDSKILSGTTGIPSEMYSWRDFRISGGIDLFSGENWFPIRFISLLSFSFPFNTKNNIHSYLNFRYKFQTETCLNVLPAPDETGS